VEEYCFLFDLMQINPRTSTCYNSFIFCCANYYR